MISRTEPGIVHVIKHGAATIRKEYEAFLHVCAIWRHLNDYDPRRSA
jgi:hypothetical protein